MNYRKRCYNEYMNTHWEHTHALSREEYDLYASVSKKRFKEILPADKSVKIIDIACGSGHFLYFMRKEGYKNIHGIDIGIGQIEAAKKMGITNVEIADIFEYLPLHPESFDMIVANDVIEHLKKDEVLEFLDMIYRALYPGGRALISTLNSWSFFGAGLVDIDFTHEQGYTPESLSQVMKVCGFKDVRIYGERPVIRDLRSAVRAVLWRCMERLLNMYAAIESGTGRGIRKIERVFEPRIYAVGEKR